MNKQKERAPLSPLERWRRSKLGHAALETRQTMRGTIFGAVFDEHRSGTALCRIGEKWFVNFGGAPAFGFDARTDITAPVTKNMQEWGIHCSSSRIYQYTSLYNQLEKRIARATGTADAVAFRSATTVHMGVLPSLTRWSKCHLIIDEFAHNTLHRSSEMCSARGSTVTCFAHNDVDQVKNILSASKDIFPIVLVDSIYSMGGDFAPLKKLHKIISESGGFLYVDDAHGTGLYGSNGGGYASEVFGNIPDNVLVVGSFSKALSGYGGFIACPAQYREFIECASEAFMFNGPIPAPMIGADIAIYDILLSDAYRSMQTDFRQCRDELRNILVTSGFSVLEPKSHILAVPLPESDALEITQALFKQGILVNLAMFPAVPRGKSVIRFTPSLLHTNKDMSKLKHALGKRK